MKTNNELVKLIVILLVVLAGTGGLIFLLVKFGGNPSAVSEANLSVPVGPNDWSKGNPNATTVVVEYGDFQCPACAQFYPVVEEIFNKNKENMKLVFRQFPLRQIHQNADLAARASEAAGKQGKFWELVDLLYKNQDSWSGSSKAQDVFIGYAASLGLDVAKFKKDLDDSAIKSKINSDIDSGFQSKVQGTPTFFLNGKMMTYSSVNEFNNLITKSINGTK